MRSVRGRLYGGPARLNLALPPPHRTPSPGLSNREGVLLANLDVMHVRLATSSATEAGRRRHGRTGRLEQLTGDVE